MGQETNAKVKSLKLKLIKNNTICSGCFHRSIKELFLLKLVFVAFQLNIEN